MNFQTLIKCYNSYGCSKLYVKTLAPNDNSKNQVYLGGSFEILNILPFKGITADNDGNWKRARFKTNLDFFWISDECKLYHAPESQLILYPKYPEVRFSGFLQGCESPPSELMSKRIDGRCLFFGITNDGKIIGYVCHPDSSVARACHLSYEIEKHGVFNSIPLSGKESKRDTSRLLLDELSRIHSRGWIDSKRLSSTKEILPCNAPQCGGYTLEAELGITPNGFSEPDYLGWEIKQFSVKNFSRLESSIVTLMTPEPTGGLYVKKGVKDFILKYGYRDKRGRADRINFGGIHKVDEEHETTKLTMKLVGFDNESGKIRNPEGYIALLSSNGEIASSWSYTSLIEHWGRKHRQASYVPSQKRIDPRLQYCYGDKVILGQGTSFDRFLQQMQKNNIYYDPGIKMENVSGKQVTKRRSQFRIKSKYLSELYEKSELVNLK